MKTLVYIIFGCLCLSGCATKVHLITQGYSEQERKQFVETLSQQGFNVREADIVMPNHFPSTVISFHPAHPKPTDIEKLKKFVAANELPQALEMQFGQKRHFYNQGNIGLYLRHPDINLNETLPLYVRSFNCGKQQATLFFSPDHKLELEYDVHRDGDYRLVFKRGFWAFDGSIVTANFEDLPPVRFIQSEAMRDTPMGPREALVYTPIKKDHTIKQLNCPYEVVFVN